MISIQYILSFFNKQSYSKWDTLGKWLVAPQQTIISSIPTAKIKLLLKYDPSMENIYLSTEPNIQSMIIPEKSMLNI